MILSNGRNLNQKLPSKYPGQTTLFSLKRKKISEKIGPKIWTFSAVFLALSRFQVHSFQCLTEFAIFPKEFAKERFCSMIAVVFSFFY